MFIRTVGNVGDRNLMIVTELVGFKDSDAPPGMLEKYVREKHAEMLLKARKPMTEVLETK